MEYFLFLSRFQWLRLGDYSRGWRQWRVDNYVASFHPHSRSTVYWGFRRIRGELSLELPFDRSFDWLIVWLIVWSIDWLFAWLIDLNLLTNESGSFSILYRRTRNLKRKTPKKRMMAPTPWGIRPVRSAPRSIAIRPPVWPRKAVMEFGWHGRGALRQRNEYGRFIRVAFRADGGVHRADQPAQSRRQ